MHELHGVSRPGHALDFHPLPAAHADVHVLAAGADAGANPAGVRATSPQSSDGVADFLRRDQLGPRDGFRQRHPQAVGAPDDAVAPVLHLAAGVLFERDVGDRELAALEGKAAVEAHDGRALEAGGNAAVQILFAGDVDLVDDVHAHREADFDGHVQRRLVHEERRRVVHLVGADVQVVQEIDDLLLRLELHQRGAVVLAQFAERRPHVAQHLAVVASRCRGRRGSGKRAYVR